MKDIPQPIKDAAEKVYPLTGFSEIVDYDRRNAQLGFIAGATHPETEKYYRERFGKFLQWTLINDWTMEISFDDPVLFGNGKDIKELSELFDIYRQSLTPEKPDTQPKQ